MTVLRVALAGLGAVGLPVAELLLLNGIPGMKLTAVCASSERSAASKLAGLEGGQSHNVLCLPASKLAEHADVIVEGLPPAAFLEVAEPTLSGEPEKPTSQAQRRRTHNNVRELPYC